MAASLRDGRWQRQHDAMRRVSASRAEIVYVIEGDPSKPVWKSTIAGEIRVDGVEGDAMIQHEHAIKF